MWATSPARPTLYQTARSSRKRGVPLPVKVCWPKKTATSQITAVVSDSQHKIALAIESRVQGMFLLSCLTPLPISRAERASFASEGTASARERPSGGGFIALIAGLVLGSSINEAHLLTNDPALPKTDTEDISALPDSRSPPQEDTR
jgi:hypothetical protein